MAETKKKRTSQTKKGKSNSSTSTVKRKRKSTTPIGKNRAGKKIGSNQKKSMTSNKNKNQQSLKLKKGTSQSGKHSKLVQMVMDGLFYVVLLGLIFSSIIFAFSGNQNKTLFGYRIFGVLTNSMAPNAADKQAGGFRAGDIIVVQDIPGDGAEVGDVITYRPAIDSDAFLTHRVIEKLDELEGEQGTYYITKGDNNGSEDVPVSAEQVVAKKLWMIPKLGSVLKFVREHFIVSTIFIVSVFGFILVVRMYFLTPETTKKNNKRYLPQRG